jgi:hypothetical protein
MDRIIVACNYQKINYEIIKGVLLAAMIGCPFYLLPNTNNLDALKQSHENIYKIV